MGPVLTTNPQCGRQRNGPAAAPNSEQLIWISIFYNRRLVSDSSKLVHTCTFFVHVVLHECSPPVLCDVRVEWEDTLIILTASLIIQSCFFSRKIKLFVLFVIEEGQKVNYYVVILNKMNKYNTYSL